MLNDAECKLYAHLHNLSQIYLYDVIWQNISEYFSCLRAHKNPLLRVLADKVYGHSNILLYNQILVAVLNLLAKLSMEFQLFCCQSFGGISIFYLISNNTSFFATHSQSSILNSRHIYTNVVNTYTWFFY